MVSLRHIAKRFILGIPVALTVFNKVGYIARVDGKSMQPFFNPGNINDYIFLCRWSIDQHHVHRGDVIAFVSPRNPEYIIVKRVIGISGDKLVSRKTEEEVLVPEGHCWVEGDHSAHSMDSNHFGPISFGLITARATAIVWPPNRWQIIRPEIQYKRLPLNLLPLK